ncbi:MAG: hypothetical protein AAF358_13530 [Pseudomonadota bacterium]
MNALVFYFVFTAAGQLAFCEAAAVRVLPGGAGFPTQASILCVTEDPIRCFDAVVVDRNKIECAPGKLTREPLFRTGFER